MAQFLRDERINDFTIDKDSITQLAAVFQNRHQSLAIQQNENKFLFYVIRFDNKGYRVFSTEELLQYFEQAKNVERIVFVAESSTSITSNRNAGAHLELRLDEKDPNNCFVSVTDDDRDWVDASFSAVHETLEKFKNHNSWARSDWMNLLIQLGGVFIGFVLSLWAALIISPMLNIENAFVIVFLFALLIFSNTWMYFRFLITKYVNKYFPSIKFYRPSKDRMHWLMQALIGGITAAIVILLLGKGFSFIGHFLGRITSNGL
ncbi:MAG: hypothetical protein RQ867_03570 [Mariprofundaceae bacterium]|nr:hypothetical protein [Mariprofundaceae bacterium]